MRPLGDGLPPNQTAGAGEQSSTNEAGS